jgi:hypothetical protein
MPAAKPHPFDPDALRIREGDYAASTPAVVSQPPKARRRKFAMPELEPGSWFIRAQQAFGPHFTAGATVALYLLMQFGIKHRDPNEPIKVSNQYLKSLGIDRFTKYRALNRLDKAGLIEIEPATSKRNKRRLFGLRITARNHLRRGSFRCALGAHLNVSKALI